VVSRLDLASSCLLAGVHGEHCGGHCRHALQRTDAGEVEARGVRAELKEHGVLLKVDLRRCGRTEDAVGEERDQQARSGRRLLGHRGVHVTKANSMERRVR